MAIDKLQASRFEMKYMINEETALKVRDFVRSYLDLDENGAGKPDYSYPVHSLYLDSDDLKLYWATINGDKNRYKLRIRFYDDRPDSPVFFEIKRRMNSCIMKQRGGVRRSAVEGMMVGQLPDLAQLVSKEAKHVLALEHFCELMLGIDAKPKALVAYRREAYVPHDDNSVRVTMDRQVRIRPEPQPRLRTAMNGSTLVWPNAVILELKFTDRFPGWFGEMVRIFQLRQQGAAKYVDGVARVGESRFGANAAADAEADEIFLPNTAGEG